MTQKEKSEAQAYRELCESTGHSIDDLVRELGVSRATIYRRFAGDAPITEEMRLAIRKLQKAVRKG